MTQSIPRPLGLLLAAHGERRQGAANQGVERLAETLRGRGLAVAVGFVSGAPSIGDGLRALGDCDVVVYPLFQSEGYFTRIRLPQLLQEAAGAGRTIRILPPLGCDPLLADLIVGRLVVAASEQSRKPSDVILLAHGSTKDASSRLAAEQLAESVRKRAMFRTVRVALLEEPPSLRKAAAELTGPIVVLGLFAGDGLHGGNDAPRLVAGLGRADAAYAGTIGSLAGIDDLVAAAVVRAIDCSGTTHFRMRS